jgi:polyether ionophore transport system permease protein
MWADQPRHPVHQGRFPQALVLRRITFATSRGGLIWGAVFGLVVVSSAVGFVSTYSTVAQRRHAAATLGTNKGLQALFGAPHHIETVGGYTAWRSLGLVTLIGAVWALLTATKQLRGEEDAGRWELLLAGQTTRRNATGQAVGGLAVGLGVLWAVTAILAVAVGRGNDTRFSVSAGLFLAVALASSAAMFLAVGALTSQLAATRRQAAGLAAGVLGGAFVLRLAADSGSGLQWVRWLSPLGWVDELRPLTGTRPVALLPILGFTIVVASAAVYLAGERDLGASMLPDRSTARAHTRLLSNSLGLSIRLARNLAISWAAGLAAYGLIAGLVAKSAGESVSRSTLARFGGARGGALGYLGVSFIVVAALIAMAAAGEVTSTRDEEGEGHLDNLLVRSVARLPWLAGRFAVATAMLVALGVVVGVFAWAGAATQQSNISLARILVAAIAVVPAAVFVLGVGTLAHGVIPRYAAAVAYGIVAWSFLVQLIGSAINANGWLLDLSVFHHLAPAPATDPNWTSAALLAALGIATAALGATAFAKRDLAAT